MTNFKSLFSPHIYTGDFNALTPADYSEEELERITEIRSRNHWELPMSDVTDKLRESGFRDAKVQTRKSTENPLITGVDKTHYCLILVY